MRTRRLDAPGVPGGGARALAIGNFDGVHIGHRALARTTADLAARQGLVPAVLTFDPHPARVLGLPDAPRVLTTLDQRAAALERDGIAELLVLPFTPAVADLEPDAFAQAVLAPLGTRVVVVGNGFRFGRQRSGDVDTLRDLGRSLGYEVRQVDAVRVEGRPVSSTWVREAVAAGDVALATRLLGRAPALVGPVVAGDGRGRGLGIPTANLAPENEILPAHGVYAGFAREVGQDVRRPAVVNVGLRPTFGAAGGLRVEAHLLDFEGDLYGRRLELELVHRIRGEQRFAGVEALVARIRGDVDEARRVLAVPGPAL